jgi:hypothetical protein
MAKADGAGLTAEQRINKLFRTALLLDASLEWVSGQSARVSLRRDGVPREVDIAPLSRQEMALLLQSIMDDRQWKTLEKAGAVVFSHNPDVGGQGLRVRVFTNSSELRVVAQPLQWSDSDAPGCEGRG